MSYTILLVEEDPGRAEALQHPLAAAGCNVVLADANLDALEVFQRIRPDLVMIEAVALDPTGLELCQALKETPQGRATPVIVVAETTPGECRRAQVLDRYRCDAFIPIPIAGDLLVENCMTLIEARQGVGNEDPDLLATLDELDAASEPPDRELLAGALDRLEAELDAATSPAASLPTPAAEAAWTDPLTASLEELSRVADDLVDRLPFEDESASAMTSAPAPPASPEEMRETLDQLSALAESLEEPEDEMDLAVDGDRGDDIADHLDALFSTGHPAPSETPRAAAVPMARVEAPVNPSADAPAAPATVAPVAAELSVPVAVAVEPQVATPPLTTQLPVTPQYYEPSGHLTQPERRSMWPIAAGLVVLLLGAAAWLLRPSTPALPLTASFSSPEVPPASAATPWGAPSTSTSNAPAAGVTEVETLALDAPTETEPTVPEAAPSGASAGSAVIPTDQVKLPAPPSKAAPREAGPAAAKAKAQPGTAVAPREVAASPPPPPPNIGGPRSSTAVDAATTPAKSDDVVRAGGSAVVRTVVRPESMTVTPPAPNDAPSGSAPAQTAPPVATSSPAGATPTTTPSGASSAPAIAQIDLSPPPAADGPSLVESAGIPTYKPPAAIQSPQPSYPPRALKRGEQGTIVLKVLVNEEGRVTRVVVDQGIAGSELEAAAIDAVLRWTYRPATEYGRPIKGWTTERFVFTPPSNATE